MSASTTVKLDAALKRRIAPLARAAGLTPHAWMVKALGAQVDAAEARLAFVQDALDAEREVERTGEVYEAADVFAWLEQRAKGKRAPRPRPARW
jgi:predicted transcriptional regulator